MPLPAAVGGRRAFLRAWAAPAATPPPASADVPPLYATLLAALLHPDADARLRADDPALPEPLRRYDPLYGQDRSPYGSGALWLQEQSAPDAAQAAALAARREEIERHVQPRDALLERCGGPAAMSRLTREELAAARALVVFDRLGGARLEPRDRRVDLAGAAIARGDVERGLELLGHVIALDPGHTDARYLLGLTLRRIGRQAEAEATFQALVDEDPRAPLSLVISAVLARERGNLERAEQDLHDALQAEPDLSLARIELVRLHILLDELDEAERLLQARDGAALPAGEAAVLRAELERRRAER
jgi:tetratricopeptide (TPR) repeat protein